MTYFLILARLAELATVIDFGVRNGAFTPSSDIPVLPEGQIDSASRNNRKGYADHVARLLASC